MVGSIEPCIAIVASNLHVTGLGYVYMNTSRPISAGIPETTEFPPRLATFVSFGALLDVPYKRPLLSKPS